MVRTLPLLLLLAPVVVAQSAPPTKATTPAENKTLSDSLQKLLLANLPDPLVQTAHNWEHQKEVFDGLRWEKKGVIRYKPHVVKELKNDGHWERVTVQAADPAKTLKLTVSNARTPEAGKTLFDAVLHTDVKLKYEQQLWTLGQRVYSGETRAKCSAGLTMTVELTSRNEPTPGSLLPTVVLRARVTEASLSYWDLECEHTLGTDGPPAKALGKAVHEVIKKVKPDLERDLLAKANAAVVKAADTKDVKVEFGNLLGMKK